VTQERILIVEDDPKMRHHLDVQLSARGYTVVLADSAEVGMQALEELTPDLVLLDIGLPEIDGYEVARRLRRSTRRHVRLVAVTGYGADSDRRHSREAGFDEHVVKPVMPETVAGIIERARQASREASYST